MATLQEEFEAFKSSQQQSSSFSLQQDYEAFKKDQAQGGSIRQAPIEPNFPIGATVGGVAAGLASPMLVPLGAAAGEAAQQLVEHAVGSPAAPQSTGEAAMRMGQEALINTAAEVGGQALGRAAHGGAFGAKITPEGQDAIRFMESKGFHGGLLPAEMTSTRILDIAQNISEFSLLGGGAIKQFKDDRNKFFTNLADEIIDRFGPRMSPDDVGRAVIDSTKRNLELSTMPAKLIYTAIERDAAPTYFDAIQGMKVAREETPINKSVVKRQTVKKVEGAAGKDFMDTADGAEAMTAPELRGMKVNTEFQDVQVGERLERLKVMTTKVEKQMSGARIDLRDMKEELAGAVDVAKRSGGLADREMGNTLMAFIANKPDIVSYPVAKAIRTEIRTLKDTLQQSVEAKNAPAIGKASAVYDKLTNAIRTGLTEHDPFVADMWDQANAIERAGNEQFNSRLIRSLVKRGNADQGGKPEAIGQAVWQKNNTTVIGKVRAAVDVEDWKKMQSLEMQNIFARAADENGVPQAKKLEQILFGPGGLGEKALETGFDKNTVTELKQLISTMHQAQTKHAEGTGRMIIQMRQGGAFLELAGAGLAAVGMTSEEYGASEIAAGAGVLLTPFMLGQLMTSPTGIKWLTEGLTTMAKGPKAAALAAKIAQSALPRVETRQTEPTAEQVPSRTPITMQPGANQQ